MKETVKKIVVGVMALATATTFFVGCTNSTETQSDTSSSSSYSEIIDTPGVPADTAPEFSVQFKYWYDTVTESFESEGDEFIVSGRTPIYASEGQFAPNDLYRHFRIEGTGERIYAISPASAEEIGGKFKAILDKSGKEQLTTLADRIKSTEKLEDALKSDTVYNVFANNMETGISCSNVSEAIPIYSALKQLDLAFFKYINGETAQLTLFTDVIGDIINIVTDNKDLITSDSTFGVDHMELNNITNPDLNSVDTGNPIEAIAPTTPTDPTTPTTHTTPTGPANPTGTTPGPYGGYYDAFGELHANPANVPRDADGYPVVSFTYANGRILCKKDKEAQLEEQRRISAGGDPDVSDIDRGALGWD